MVRRGLAGLAAAMTAIAVAACGEGRTFSAQEFVDEVNAQGVELRLGGELLTEEQGKELYDIELEPVADLPGEAGHSDSSGSLSVYDGTDGADAEIESCRAAADLLCYQAGNVVVVLQTAGIESQQLAKAMERLAEE